MDAIVFACDCGRVLSAKPALAGKLARCPKCHKQLIIPQTAEKATGTSDDIGLVPVASQAAAHPPARERSGAKPTPPPLHLDPETGQKPTRAVMKWIWITLAVVMLAGGAVFVKAHNYAKAKQVDLDISSMKDPSSLHVAGNATLEKAAFKGYFVRAVIANGAQYTFHDVRVEINLYQDDPYHKIPVVVGSVKDSPETHVDNIEPGAQWLIKVPIEDKGATDARIVRILASCDPKTPTPTLSAVAPSQPAEAVAAPPAASAVVPVVTPITVPSADPKAAPSPAPAPAPAVDAPAAQPAVTELQASPPASQPVAYYSPPQPPAPDKPLTRAETIDALKKQYAEKVSQIVGEEQKAYEATYAAKSAVYQYPQQFSAVYRNVPGSQAAIDALLSPNETQQIQSEQSQLADLQQQIASLRTAAVGPWSVGFEADPSVVAQRNNLINQTVPLSNDIKAYNNACQSWVNRENQWRINEQRDLEGLAVARDARVKARIRDELWSKPEFAFVYQHESIEKSVADNETSIQSKENVAAKLQASNNPEWRDKAQAALAEAQKAREHGTELQDKMTKLEDAYFSQKGR